MSKMLSSSAKNDIAVVKEVKGERKVCLCLEALGICKSATLKIFYRDRHHMILFIGKTKLAISIKIAHNILIF